MTSGQVYFTEQQLADLRERAYAMLDERRIAHVQGCEQTALALSERWGGNPSAAAAAAVLHDITKKLSTNEQLQLLKKYDIVPDNDLLSAPKLLHAVTGALLAKELFGMPEEITEAIRWHTSGKPAMTLLEKIIYMADYIEPTRSFDGVEKLRKEAFRDLDCALAVGLKMSLEEVRRNGSEPHHDTVDAFHYYMHYMREENNMLSPAEIAGIAAKALDDKKAMNIKVLKTEEQTVLADYFVICNGTSSAHIKALVGEVDKQLSEAGEPPVRREGLRSDIWVLMDFGSVIVHIFTEEARRFYNLERLWSDSEEVDPSALPRP